AARRRPGAPSRAVRGDRPAAGGVVHRVEPGRRRRARGPRARVGVTTPVRPILGSSCAQAATAEEARFRIDRPIAGRVALIVALDDGAVAVVERLAERPWGAARFFHSAARVKLTVAALQAMKPERRKIVGVVCWDAATARLADQAGADLVSVGDSAIESFDELLTCCRAVRRGVTRAVLSCDVPEPSVEA